MNIGDDLQHHKDLGQRPASSSGSECLDFPQTNVRSVVVFYPAEIKQITLHEQKQEHPQQIPSNEVLRCAKEIYFFNSCIICIFQPCLLVIT